MSDPSSAGANVPASMAEHYRTSDYAAFEQEHRLGGTFELTMMEVHQGAGEFIDPSVPEFGFVSSKRPVRHAEHDFGDGWKRHSRIAPFVDIQPANTECLLRLPPTHLRVAIVGEAVLAKVLDEASGANAGALAGAMGQLRHLPRAASWIDRMWTATSRHGTTANLEVDAAFLFLLAELLRACGDDRPFAPVPSVGDRRIARVIEYVEAYIAEPLTVGELAAIAHVSVFHFGRVFKREIGQTPHRYVMGRRIERAKELLVTTDWDLTAIAMKTGFASHSHLTEAFHRATGMPPGQWRRAQRD